ncbi:hypothetical protein [Dongshaea marina]|nr:hypothetical protein [Dongshaea marina]
MDKERSSFWEWLRFSGSVFAIVALGVILQLMVQGKINAPNLVHWLLQ